MANLKDMYVENNVVAQKEDLVRLDPSKFVFATKNNDETTYDLSLDSDIKHVYLVTEGDVTLRESELKWFLSAVSGEGLSFTISNVSSPLYRDSDYLKIIAYKTEDRKNAVFTETYNFSRSAIDWIFYSNSKKSQSSNAADFGFSLTKADDGRSATSRFAASGSGYYYEIKIFSGIVTE